MSDTASRAGFNVRHLRHGTGTRRDRASLLHESMRELDEKAARYYAQVNENIVAADTRLNAAFVNDGAGGFRAAKSKEEVLDYGDSRIGTRQNVKKEDRIGNDGRKWDARSFETTLIVSALPKSLCVEVPDFYPVFDDDGEPVLDPNGNQLRRSRWVARDRDEALAYFGHVAAFLGDHVLEGGQAAIHGYDVNLDEGYPHLQLMADTLATNPKKAGQLRCAAQEMWGRTKGDFREPGEKMSDYQAAFREHMIGLGYDVERDAAERGPSSHTREEWAALQNRERIAENALAVAAQDREQVAEKVTEVNEYIAEKLPKLRAKAKEEGRSEGYDAGRAEGQAEVDKERRRAAEDARKAAIAREAAERAQLAGFQSGKARVKDTLDAAEAILVEVEGYRDKVVPKLQQVIDQNNAAARRKTERLRATVEQHTQDNPLATDHDPRPT